MKHPKCDKLNHAPVPSGFCEDCIPDWAKQAAEKAAQRKARRKATKKVGNVTLKLRQRRDGNMTVSMRSVGGVDLRDILK